MENKYKLTVEEFEDQVSRLKMEMSNMEIDKDQLEREINHDTNSKNIFLHEIEVLQEKVRQLEDQLQKADQKGNESVNDVKSVLKDFEKQNIQNKNKIARLEKDIKEYKENREKRAKDLEEYKAKANQKEKEISSLRNKLDNWDKEKEYLKKDYEDLKKSNDKIKVEYKETLERMKQVKENHQNEIRKYEDKINTLEKKLENDRNQVIILGDKLKEKESNFLARVSCIERKSMEEGISMVTSLSEVMESFDDENKANEQMVALEAKNIELKNEIEKLNIKLKEITNKQNSKANAELELLRKENSTLKQNIKETQEMYENQIKDLQKKTVSVNNEYQNFKRMSSKMSLHGGKLSLQGGQFEADIQKHLQVVNDLEAKIKTQKAELKFLDDKVELLSQEIESQKKLREKDVTFLKEELKRSDLLAVEAKVKLAQIVYDKDDEIATLKGNVKKLKTKLITIHNELRKQPTSVTQTIKNFFN